MTQQFRSMDTGMDRFIEPSEFIMGRPGPAPAPLPFSAPAPAQALPPCSTMPTTTVPCGHADRPTKSPREQEHDQLQNVAHQIASGTAEALASVLKAGDPSDYPEAAQTHLYTAQAKAKEVLPGALQADNQASEMIKTVDRLKTQGITTYADEIRKVQVPAPLIPSLPEREEALDLSNA